MADATDAIISTPEQTTPLLSICIPTCNRANFLRVMLQALLPQAAECGSAVEVWVLDNGSTDDTAAVLEKSRDLGPFQIHRQPTNVGPLRNIIDGPVKLAIGRYTWILGDHNLLRPGGLARLVRRLRQEVDLSVFYVNFRAAAYPQQWPTEATGGYDGAFTYLGNPELTGDVVQQWTDLIRPYSAACTQVYVHIVKTTVWRDYWANREIGEPYTSALTTYPHTVTLLNSVGNKPAGVVREPIITIYNGAQSWNNPAIRIGVFFSGLSDLLLQIQTCGLTQHRMSELWLRFFRPEAKNVALDCYRRTGRFRSLKLLLRNTRGCWENWRVLLCTLFPGLFPGTSRHLRSLFEKLTNYREWYIYNCRPARWLRSR